MAVDVHPLPHAYRDIPERLRPGHPPIFDGDGEPSEQDILEAKALFAELDAESQRWYSCCDDLFGGLDIAEKPRRRARRTRGA